jgi:hypothetical protein
LRRTEAKDRRERRAWQVAVDFVAVDFIAAAFGAGFAAALRAAVAARRALD